MIGNKSFCERLPQMTLKAYCLRLARTGQEGSLDIAFMIVNNRLSATSLTNSML